MDKNDSYLEFLSLDVEELLNLDYVEKNSINALVGRLSLSKKIIDEMIFIYNDLQENYKPLCSRLIDYFVNNINGSITQLRNHPQGSTAKNILIERQQSIIKFNQFLDRINTPYFSTNDSPVNLNLNLLTSLSLVKSLSSNEFDSKKTKEIIENEFMKFKGEYEKINAYTEQAKSLLDTIQDKSANLLATDYSNIFQIESTNFDKAATKWLYSGILAIIGFITTLFIFILFKPLPSEIIRPVYNSLGQLSDEKIIYLYSNIFLKIVIFSFELYMVSFFFKQYLINKHQQVINKHRKNSLDSFELFSKSLKGDDQTSKNSLMIQVAKAIYDNPNTGFISDKGGATGPSFVELTKFVDSSKNQ